MSEFKIASNLDLSTNEAKAKLKELEKGNIKKKLELDTGNINKNIQNQVKEREKYEKNSLGNLEKSKTKTLDNLHRKRLKQEAEYQRAVSDSAKKTASDKIKQTEKEIANESKKLSRLGKSYADYVKGINSGFKFDRNTKELAKGFAQAEKDVQKIKNTINSIENPLAKSFKNTAQNQSDSILKSIRKNTMSSDNLRNIERRSASLQNYVKNIGKLDKIERKVGSKYFKAKDNLDGFSNIITQDRAKKISRNLSNKFDSIKPTTVSGTTNTLKEFNAELGRTEVQTKGLKKLDNLTRRLSSFENSLKPKEINKYRKALVDLSKADSIGSGNYMGRLKALDTQMTVASRYRSSMDRFRNDFRSSFLGTSVGYLAGAALRRQIGAMVETYKGLDASMTNVKKVAKAADVRTKKQIKGIQDWAINTGKQVGMSSADIQNSLATSIQSGMGSMKSSMAVARKSMILANVGDMNKDEATKAVNTLVKAFGITPLAKIKRGIKGIVKETTQLDDALNKINYLGNNYAISSAGVAEAIQNGGSVLSNYGISYADSMGLITAANEPLQNPKKVGNGLKSIAINFAGMAASAKDGKLQLNKTAKALSEIAGINVYKDKAKGQLKNMVQLLDELHPKWNRLNDDQRAGLSEAIAGKHRANVFQALMGNYEQFKKIRKEFAQGDDFGSAEKENAKYVDSMAGKANKLKETMTSVATSLFSTDMAKSGLNGLIKFGEGLEKVIKWADKTNTTLPVLMAGMAGLKGVFGALKEPIKDYETLLYGDSKTKNQPIWERMSNYTKDKKKTSSSTKKDTTKKKETTEKKNKLDFDNASIIDLSSKKHGKLNEKLKEGQIEQKKYSSSVEEGTRSHKKAHSIMLDVEKSTGNASKNLEKNSSKIKTTGLAFKELGKSFMGAIGTTLLSSAAVGATTLVLSKSIEYGAKLWDNFAHGVENAKNKALEHRDGLLQQSKSISENTAFVKQNAKEIDTIAQKQRQYSKMDTKSMTDDQIADMNRVNQMAQKLAEIFPNLVSGYDKNGNPLLSLTTSADKLGKRLEIAKKRQDELLRANNRTIQAKNATLMTQGEKVGVQGGVLKQIKDLSKGLEYRSIIDSRTGKSKNYNSKLSEIFGEHFKSAKSFAEGKRKFNQAYQSYEDSVNDKFQKWQGLVSKFDSANAQATSTALTELANKRGFSKLKDQNKEAISELGSMMQWGLSKNLNGDINDLIRVGNKLSPDKISAFSRELQKLNDVYKLDKDYKSYSKGIDEIANKLSKASGGSAKAWADKLRDVNRGYQSLEEKREIDFMRKHGAKPSDIEYGTDSQRVYADKIQQRYRGIKESIDGIMKAQSRGDVLSNWEQMANNEALPNNIKNIAKGLYENQNAGQAAQSGMFKYLNSLENFDFSSANAQKNLKNFEDGLRSLKKGGEDITLPTGEIMSNAEAWALWGDKTKSAAKSIEDFKNIDKLQAHLENVDNFYKDKKIEIPIEVKMKLADSDLTDRQLNEMENQIKEMKLNGEQSNDFRKTSADYWKISKDKNDFWEKYSKSSSGLRDALENGSDEIVSRMSKINPVAKEISDNFSKLSDNAKSFANSIQSNTDWDAWMRKFGSLNSGLQGVINKHPLDIEGMSTAEKLYNTGKDLGMDSNKITKTIDFILNQEGVSGLKEIEGMINSIPDNTTKSLVFNAVGGEHGAEVINTLNMLNASIPDETTKNIIINAIANTDAFKNGQIQSIQDLVNALPPEIRSVISVDYDNGKITLAKEDIDSLPDKKVNVNVSANTNKAKNDVNKLGDGKPIKKDVQANTDGAKSKIDGLSSNPLNIPVYLKPDSSGLYSALGGTGLSNFSLDVKIPKMPDISKVKSQNVNINVKVNVGNATSALSNIKSMVNSLPRNRTTTLKATNNASGAISSVKSAIASIPRSRTTTLKATNNASGAISSVKSAIASIPRSRTTTLTTVHETIYRTRYESGGGGSGGRGGILGVFGLSLPAPRNTQLNPLMTSTPAVAGTTSVGGVVSSVSSFASPMAAGSSPKKKIIADYIGDAESFKIRELEGYAYRGISTIHKLTFSVKELNDAFKENADILYSFDRALTRVDQAVKKIDLHLSRARGATKEAFLKLQSDQLREGIRRAEAKEKALIQERGNLRNTLRKDKVSFAHDGTIQNKLQKELEWKKKIEGINKKLEKSKDKNKKKLEDEKKAYEDKIRMIERYTKNSDELSDIDYKKSEYKYKIENNNDERHKLRIEAWNENFDAVSKLMDNRIKGINDKLNLLGIRLKYAFNTDRLSILKQEVAEYENMKNALESNISTLKNLQGNLQSKLKDYGFTFSSDGEITNYQERINQLKDQSTLYNEIKGLANNYFDIIKNKLPNATKEWEEHNSKIKDANKQLLEDTKNIEDKIISMLKKSTEDRIKDIEKEVDARKKLIDKRKEEYTLARKEADYQDDIAEKMKELEKLRKKLNIYSRDTSQSGQKKFQKLQEEYDRKQKDFNKTVERHTDDIVLKGYDDESKRLDDRVRQQKDEDEKSTNENDLRRKALEAIARGTIEVNGNIIDLKKALIDYMNKHEGGLGVMGAFEKAEMLAKLASAKNVSVNYSNILSAIGIPTDLNTGFIQNEKFRELAKSKDKNNITQNIGSLVTINGNLSEAYLSEMLKIVQEEIRKNNKNIVGNVG